MKIISYNVNGIRAALNKDWMKWVTAVDPDIICLQETKAQPEQIDTELFASFGYETYGFRMVSKHQNSNHPPSPSEHVVVCCCVKLFNEQQVLCCPKKQCLSLGVVTRVARNYVPSPRLSL